MITLLAVLVGGVAGAIARQEGFSAIQERVRTKFPVGILAVNLSGAFVLGLLFGLDVSKAWPAIRVTPCRPVISLPVATISRTPGPGRRRTGPSRAADGR